MKKPRIALTMGDIAGIGPELVARASVAETVRACCMPIVIGHPELLKRELTALEISSEIYELGSLDEIPKESTDTIFCWNPLGSDTENETEKNGKNDVLKVAIGTLDARAGAAAFTYLKAATEAALHHKIDGITTAPLNKAALHLAGHHYPGHTEILAEQCGVHQFAMMLYLAESPWLSGAHGLSIAHVTLHTSVASVPGLLNEPSVFEKIELIDSFMKRVGCELPRIAVCALNPHAGEQGLFGDEEARIIAPAVQLALDKGINATGPLSADTLIRRAVSGEFDGVVAMYHDQGHIAMKLIGFDEAVNVTLGLPIVRTSPSHGTAFDIAGQRSANPSGMISAIQVAAKLASKHQSE